MERSPSITLPAANSSGRHTSPPPQGVRQRPLGRASTFADTSHPLKRRRSSMFSETLSDTRKSLRSSTDDLFLPRVKSSDETHEQDESTHWHSLPLGMALLPAVGGLLFKDGSAIVTDITLLGLAAIFMNWALRMPWDWYRAAQFVSVVESPSLSVFSPIDEVDETHLGSDKEGMEVGSDRSEPKSIPESKPVLVDPEKDAAAKELRMHELLALLSCFVLPVLAAWLLHAIRSQLSRPSEGLVSNYNLGIFLLVAEIRPLAHLIKMIQRKTLFLQRKVSAESLQDIPAASNAPKMTEMLLRVEELEAHVANGIAASESRPAATPEEVAAKASAHATSELRKSVQPELDALNRAMRRYEKRTTISSVQIETRLQDLETRLKDVVVLAAAAQRNADRQPTNYIVILTNWLCAVIVVPVQYMIYLLTIPSRILGKAVSIPRRYLFGTGKSQKQKDSKPPRRGTTPRPADRDRRLKTPG